MSQTLAEVTHNAIELPENQRLILARILLDISDTSSVPLDEIEAEWEKEISRRIGLVDSGKAEGKPWAEVPEEVNRNLR
jgi:hypothetical protein